MGNYVSTVSLAGLNKVRNDASSPCKHHHCAHFRHLIEALIYVRTLHPTSPMIVILHVLNLLE